MDGSQVWGAYQEGRLREIRSYCETDAANTYLVYLRFQLLRGAFDAAQYRREVELLRDTLAKSAEPHWREFLEAWK
jgi:predicted PolB exonuclease-like 3'-5' exonuclease